MTTALPIFARGWCVALALLLALMPAAGLAAEETMRCALADGFDFPVGKPDGEGYYKSRGYYPNGHLGEDWNGKGGGNTDLGSPIYSIARGVVVISDDFARGWGNCVIVRHPYRETDGAIRMVDSLYAHLDRRLVRRGDVVQKGQQVGTMGSNRGMYMVHLHLEIRKNLKIGMNRPLFARNNTNYFSPTDFIRKHRQLSSGLLKVAVPMAGFAPYGKTLPSEDSGSRRKPAPSAPEGSPGPSDDDEDFWSKLRDRLRRSQITPGTSSP